MDASCCPIRAAALSPAASAVPENANATAAGLHRDDRSQVKDLFDLSRIDYDDFEANRDLWSITDLDCKNERVKVVTEKDEFFPTPLPPPHGCPESHGFPVYPVSSSRELEKELEKLAENNGCTARNTARVRRWKLLQDLAAVEKRIARKLATEELMSTFSVWYRVSQPHLDPKKTRDHYLGAFFAEACKVRVPTGEGDTLKKALEHLSMVPLPKLPGTCVWPESWHKVAALHGELARLSANGTYFLSCRDAAKADSTLNKDSAARINLALAQIDVIELLRVGSRGKASEYRYLLPLETSDLPTEAFVIKPALSPAESVLLTTSHVNTTFIHPPKELPFPIFNRPKSKNK